ncbi:Armadillo [Corchorus olitorius]|uniref:Armadillo n=1 Tax=Corchorus olitorius TaxID=93759 RepID=A0A1R3KB06_9ROSI|nr:Armadillo [Corchorus olitorius]
MSSKFGGQFPWSDSAHMNYIGLVAQAGAIPLFAELIQGPEPLGQEVAEDAFCILAVAEENAVSIAEHLVRILREGNSEAKAAAANIVWDLSGYKHTVSVVRNSNSGAIPCLVELLGSQSSEVKEAVSGAIAQLSYHEADREALIESGAVTHLLELLHDDSEELRDNAAEALINFYEDPLQHDRISEVVDLPAFRNMQNRLFRIRAYDDQTVDSMGRMTIEQLTRDPDLI